MDRTPWETLVERYARGRPICNCQRAYYTCEGSRMICQNGCQTNLRQAQESIARSVIEELNDLLEEIRGHE